MVFLGRVKDGVVVPDGPVELPEGAAVRIEILSREAAAESDEPLSDLLLRYAGKAVGLPPDAARNHDHYLYGTGQCYRKHLGGCVRRWSW